MVPTTTARVGPTTTTRQTKPASTTTTAKPSPTSFGKFVGVWQVDNDFVFRIATNGSGEIDDHLGCCTVLAPARFQLTSLRGSGLATGHIVTRYEDDPYDTRPNVPLGPITFQMIDNGNGIRVTPTDRKSYVGCNEVGFVDPDANPGCV